MFQRRLLEDKLVISQGEMAAARRQFSQLIGPTRIAHMLKEIEQSDDKCWRSDYYNRQQGLMTLNILLKGISKNRTDLAKATAWAKTGMNNIRYWS